MCSTITQQPGTKQKHVVVSVGGKSAPQCSIAGDSSSSSDPYRGTQNKIIIIVIIKNNIILCNLKLALLNE